MKKKGLQHLQTPTQATNKKPNKLKKSLINSEPQPKRKKLIQEIDEQISEDEFDAALGSIKKKLKNKKDEDNSFTGSKNSLNFDDDDDEDMSFDDDDDDMDEDDDEIEEDEDDDDSDYETPKKKSLTDKLDKKIEKEIKEKLEKKKKENDVKKKKKKIETKDKILKSDDPSVVQGELERKLRDERSMFIKLLPLDVDVDSIRMMSVDIIGVRLLNRGKNKSRSAFLEFHDPETRDRNYESVRRQIKKISSDIIVDYAGSRSKYTREQEKKKKQALFYNPLKLFVTGFHANETTKEEIRQLFPKASKIEGEFVVGDGGDGGDGDNDMKLLTNHVTVCFLDQSHCKGAKAKPLKCRQGNELLVQFAKADHRQQRRAYKKEVKRKKRKELALKRIKEGESAETAGELKTKIPERPTQVISTPEKPEKKITKKKKPKKKKKPTEAGNSVVTTPTSKIESSKTTKEMDNPEKPTQGKPMKTKITKRKKPKKKKKSVNGGVGLTSPKSEIPNRVDKVNKRKKGKPED